MYTLCSLHTHWNYYKYQLNQHNIDQSILVRILNILSPTACSNPPTSLLSAHWLLKHAVRLLADWPICRLLLSAVQMHSTSDAFVLDFARAPHLLASWVLKKLSRHGHAHPGNSQTHCSNEDGVTANAVVVMRSKLIES
jgi:hypothetical protein